MPRDYRGESRWEMFFNNRIERIRHLEDVAYKRNHEFKRNIDLQENDNNTEIMTRER